MQGQTEKVAEEQLPAYDPTCYLCSGNVRVNGEKNPDYKGIFVFENDFGSLMKDSVESADEQFVFFSLKPERGINRVICFSENHSLTLPKMEIGDIKKVVDVWQEQYKELAVEDYINHVQIFENKGSVMGCSNPHPHGQIWAQSSIPSTVLRTQENLKKYFDKNTRSLLEDYIKKELEIDERVILENQDFVALVPFWAVWPYETLIVSKRKAENISEFSESEKISLADIIKNVTTKYDNLFEVSFPYSAGIHQSPTDEKSHPEWHFHMHFYPPLLRNAEIKKFMVGYEMLAEPQRDITPEQSAEILKKLSLTHYSKKDGL